MKSLSFLRNSSLILMMSLAVLACGGQKPSQTQPQTQPTSFSPDALTGGWDFVEGKVYVDGQFESFTADELASRDPGLLSIEFKPNQVILNAQLDHRTYRVPRLFSARWNKNQIFLAEDQAEDQNERTFTASIVDSRLTLEMSTEGVVIFFTYKRHVPAERNQDQLNSRGRGENFQEGRIAEERVSPQFRGRMMWP